MNAIRLIVLALALALCLHAPVARAESNQATPSVSTLMKLATGVEFSDTAVTDDPVPAEARQLNPAFRIAVYYRMSKYSVRPSPEVGGIVAKVALKGVPKARGLPDGDYYLWVGGPDDSMRATMVKVDGTMKRDVDVLSKPSLAEETATHSPSVHIEIEAAALPGTQPGAPPRQPPPPPPPREPRKEPPRKEPPPKEPPPQRSWRQICVNPPSDHGGKRWIRVPDN